MRPLLILLLGAGYACSALAQTPANPTYVPPNPMQNAPNQPLQPGAPNASQLPADDIGYDPKVKRDPNGNVISDQKNNGNALGEYQNLRRDTNLRSDRKIFSPPQTQSAPTQQPPVNPPSSYNQNGTAPLIGQPGQQPLQLRPANGNTGNQ